jgi:hypothetical protein
VVADAGAGVDELSGLLSATSRNDAGATAADGHDWARRSAILLEFLRSLPRPSGSRA